jgi:hypothetical protein
VVSTPSAVLQYPYPSEPIPSTLNEVLQLGDWLSPSHALLKGIELVFGFNPAEQVGEWVAGDWHGMAVGSTALNQLGEYCQALGKDIYQAKNDMLELWDGHAASQANVYFEKLATAIDQLQSPLRGLATEYQTLAAGMLEFASAIASIMEMLLDKLIEMGMKALAATALSETVIGGVIFGGWAAYDAYKANKLWMQAVEWHGRAVTAANGFVGLTAGYLGALHGPDGLVVPQGYDHPGATH